MIISLHPIAITGWQAMTLSSRLEMPIGSILCMYLQDINKKG